MWAQDPWLPQSDRELTCTKLKINYFIRETYVFSLMADKTPVRHVEHMATSELRQNELFVCKYFGLSCGPAKSIKLGFLTISHVDQYHQMHLVRHVFLF